MPFEQVILIIGGGILLLLGVAHGLMVLSDIVKPRFFAPSDLEQIETLKSFRIRHAS